MYKYTCTNCKTTEYGDHILSTQRCNACGSLAFGLRPRVYVESITCPRCSDQFIGEHFRVCGGCLTDMDRANRGMPPIHFTR